MKIQAIAVQCSDFAISETGVRVVFRHEGNDERGHVVRHVDRLQLAEVAHDVPEVHGRSEGGGDLRGAAVRRARRRAGGIAEEGYRVAGVHEGVDRVRADVQHEVARPGHEAARDQNVNHGAEDNTWYEREHAIPEHLAVRMVGWAMGVRERVHEGANHRV